MPYRRDSANTCAHKIELAAGFPSRKHEKNRPTYKYIHTYLLLTSQRLHADAPSSESLREPPAEVAADRQTHETENTRMYVRATS